MLAVPTFKTPAPNRGYQTSFRQAYEPSPGSQIPALPPPTSQQQGLDFAYGLNAPTLAALQQQAGQYQSQIGMTQAGYGMARGAAQQDAAAQNAKINLGPEYDAIQRAANNRGMAGIDAAENLAYQALGNQFEGFDLRKQQAWGAAQRAQWDAKTDATQKGAMGSLGFKRRMGSIQSDLANQLTGIGIDKDAATFSARQAQADRREAKARLDDNNKTLDIKAKEYGIDRQQVQANLQQGLAKLGIDQTTSVNQILDMLSSNDIQQRAVAEQIFRQGMEYGGMFETLPQNTLPSTASQYGTGVTGGANPLVDEGVDQFMHRGATAPRRN